MSDYTLKLYIREEYQTDMQALIDEEVTYRDVVIEGKSIRDYSYLSGAVIESYRCSCCGEMFDRIEIRRPKNDGEIRIK